MQHALKNRFYLVLALAGLSVYFSGCASVFERKAPTERSRRTTPPVATSEFEKEATSAPERPPVDQSRPAVGSAGTSAPQKIAVVLGPGGFKAFAHAGVLKELVKARIPIQKIVGIEWGSLVAGLFAQRSQIHDMEWKLYKLDRQEIPSRKFLSSKVEALKVSAWRDYLRESFGRQDMEHMPVGFSCPQQTFSGAELVWPAGELSVAVEQCLAAPPLFESDSGRWAAVTAAGAAIEKLHREGFDFVILINVLGVGPLMSEKEAMDSSATAMLWAEVRRTTRLAGSRAEFMIDVNTQSFGLLDFNHRRDFVMMGEKAGAEAARRLAEKYGL